MTRKKIHGICKIVDCQREIDSLELCRLHYARQYKNGTTELINRKGKTKHVNYRAWLSLLDYGSLPEEWKDFWKFVEDVEERPSINHYLVKKNRKLPYSKNNVDWLLHIKRMSQETDKEWNARKWKARLERYPALNSNNNTYKAVGLSPQLFNELVEKKLIEQNNLCEICNREEPIKKNNKKYRLSLDHCHKTNKVRGMLCWRCNTTLGKLEESIPLLQSMIKYIEKYSN